MQSRFAIVVMSAAGGGLLFSAGLLVGLGVMSPPKGGQDKQISVTTEPVQVAQRETTGSASNSDRPLSPLTPVHPGLSAAAAKSAPQTQSPAPASAPVAQASAQPALAPAEPGAHLQKPADPVAKVAKAMPAGAPAPVKPTAAATSLQTPNACDIEACARAYRSFRESDCTYQPYSGPRQLCVTPPGAKEASRKAVAGTAYVRVHRGVRNVEVENVPREDAGVTDGASGRDGERVTHREYRRDITAEGEDDGIDDSRAIVRRRDGSRSDYYDDGWHRSFFAPVDDDNQ